jgi:transcriptional regulator with XRE-family HTH domain
MSFRATYPDRSHPQLRALRLEKELSQDELAYRTGVAQSRISRAERGFLWLDDEEAVRIAAALGVELNALGGAPGPSTSADRTPPTPPTR